MALTPKVLLVEDNAEMAYLIECNLAGKVKVIWVTTSEAAKAAYEEHSGEFAGVILDGSLGNGEDTLGLIEWFCTEIGFSGHLVTASSEPERNREMMRAGCTVHASKLTAPMKLLEVLSLLG